MSVYRRPDPIPLPRAATAAVKPIQRQAGNLHALAARQIFLAIATNRFSATHVLPNEHELGQSLGVSRTVVRESIKELASKSIVEPRRRRGTLILDRDLWNTLDIDVMDWLRRTERSSDVSVALWQALAVTQPTLAAMAAQTKDHAVIGHKVREVVANPADTEMGARCLRDVHLSIAAASPNVFLRTLTRKCLDGLMSGDEAFLAERFRRTDPSFYRAVGDAIAAADPAAARTATEALFASTHGADAPV